MVHALPQVRGRRVKLTAITCTYNQRPDLLERSVLGSLDAGCDEVLVVDDGSDEPVATQRDWPIGVRIAQLPHRGVCRAFNSAIALLTGELAIRVPSDDVLSYVAVKRQRTMAKHGVQASFVDAVDADTLAPLVGSDTDSRHPAFRGRLAHSNRFYGGGSMLTVALLRRYLAGGGHPWQLTYAHDWHLHCWVEREVGWRKADGFVRRGVYDHGCGQNMDSAELHRQNVWVRERWA